MTSTFSEFDRRDSQIPLNFGTRWLNGPNFNQQVSSQIQNLQSNLNNYGLLPPSLDFLSKSNFDRVFDVPNISADQNTFSYFTSNNSTIHNPVQKFNYPYLSKYSRGFRANIMEVMKQDPQSTSYLKLTPDLIDLIDLNEGSLSHTTQSSSEMTCDSEDVTSDEVTNFISDNFCIEGPTSSEILLCPYKRVNLDPSYFRHGCICGHNFKFRDIALPHRNKKYQRPTEVTIRPTSPIVPIKLRS